MLTGSIIVGNAPQGEFPDEHFEAGMIQLKDSTVPIPRDTTARGRLKVLLLLEHGRTSWFASEPCLSAFGAPLMALAWRTWGRGLT